MKKFIAVLFIFLSASFSFAQSVVFPGPGISVPQPAILTAVANSSIEALGQTVFTFSSLSCPNPTSSRQMFVTIAGRTGGTSISISSVTIGGVSATQDRFLAVAGSGSGENSVAIYRAAVPTGTTCTVVVTYSANYVRVGVGLYEGQAINSLTPTGGGTSNASAPINNLAISANGFGLGVCYTQAATSATWTGLTEDYDVTGGSFANTWTSAHLNSSAGGTITSTCTWGSSAAPAGAFTAYR